MLATLSGLDQINVNNGGMQTTINQLVNTTTGVIQTGARGELASSLQMALYNAAVIADPSGTLGLAQAAAPQIVNALTAISTAALNNSATDTNPTAADYTAAGITGVTSTNLAAINSALNDSDIVGTSVDTPAEIQTLVNSYNAILAAADGTAGNGTAPTASDYTNVGINGIDTTAEVSLLGSVIDAKSITAVDTAAELQALADAVQAVMTTAAGGTPSVTQAQLELLGITGVTADNLAAITQAIANTADNGSEVSSLSALQAAATTAATAAAGKAATTVTATAADVEHHGHPARRVPELRHPARAAAVPVAGGLGVGPDREPVRRQRAAADRLPRPHLHFIHPDFHLRM